MDTAQLFFRVRNGKNNEEILDKVQSYFAALLHNGQIVRDTPMAKVRGGVLVTASLPEVNALTDPVAVRSHSATATSGLWPRTNRWFPSANLYSPMTEVRRLSESIVCLRRASYQTCSYIVRHADGVVLVDAGMSSDASDVLAGLRALNADADDIRAILLTHWHNDHAAGAHRAHALSGAAVHYHQADERFFTGVGGAKGLRGWISDQIPEWGVLVLAKGLIGEATPRPVAAQYFVRDGEVLLDAFEVIETPGHTAGHCSYFYRPERALFAGDALAVIDGRVRFMARPVTLDLSLARRSMERCLELAPDMVCPGHREPLLQAESACGRMLSHLRSGARWPLLG